MDSWFVFAWVITSLGHTVCVLFCVESESEQELSEEEIFFFDFLGGLAFSFFRGEFCVGDLEGDTRLSDLVFFILCIFFCGAGVLTIFFVLFLVVLR